jgi:hypothetical protein
MPPQKKKIYIFPKKEEPVTEVNCAFCWGRSWTVIKYILSAFPPQLERKLSGLESAMVTSQFSNICKAQK